MKYTFLDLVVFGCVLFTYKLSDCISDLSLNSFFGLYYFSRLFCLVCNMIENAILSFLQSSRNVLPEDRIIELASAFYAENKVKEAKEAVFNLVEKPFTVRRRTNTCLNTAVPNCRDVLALFEELEQDEVDVPVFVTKGYGTVPQGAGFEMLANVISSMRDEITQLRFECEQLKKDRESDVGLIEDATTIREEVADIKKI